MFKRPLTKRFPSNNDVKEQVKVAHKVTGTFAEEHLDLAQGILVLKRQPTVLLQGKPSRERKRIKISDIDCDTYVESYILSCAASDEATDLTRQIEDYKMAHPSLFESSLGEPPPIDPIYENLKIVLANKMTIIQSEQVKQSTIIQKYLENEEVTYYIGIRIESGEIVLGDKPID